MVKSKNEKLTQCILISTQSGKVSLYVHKLLLPLKNLHYFLLLDVLYIFQNNDECRLSRVAYGNNTVELVDIPRTQRKNEPQSH